METTVFELEFNDGRIFRVFCANSTQKKKFLNNHYKYADKVKDVRVLTTGIHTIKEFEQIVNNGL
jgi:hypothetical protein